MEVLSEFFLLVMVGGVLWLDCCWVVVGSLGMVEKWLLDVIGLLVGLIMCVVCYIMCIIMYD